MNLVLYSGGQSKNNQILHRELVRLAKKVRKTRGKGAGGLSMTYLPYCSDNYESFFRRAVKRYRDHGIEQFFCLNTDDSPSREAMKQALQSDIIYLAGGNTFYFLKYLRASGMLKQLAAFAKRGGVLAGLSAGGLIMSPTIKMAGEKNLTPDPNKVRLKTLKGLGLFPFEFSPHFDNTKDEIKAHLHYSLKTKHPIFAVKDGAGIVIEGDKINIYGHANLFHRGHRRIFKTE